MAAALALAGTLAPRAVAACTCAPPSLLAPADGATDVPRNTKLWATLGDAGGGLELIGPDGPVPGATTTIGAFDGRVTVFTPDAPLEPGAVYRGASRFASTTFTVGAAMDSEAPGVPEIVERYHDRGWDTLLGDSTCDGGPLLFLDIEGGETLTVVDLDRTSDLDPEAPEGGVSTFAFLDPAPIGVGGCTANWERLGMVGVRLGTFDLAGNFSGWSEDSAEVVAGVGAECGCSSARVGGSAWPALALLALFTARRRR